GAAPVQPGDERAQSRGVGRERADRDRALRRGRGADPRAGVAPLKARGVRVLDRQRRDAGAFLGRAAGLRGGAGRRPEGGGGAGGGGGGAGGGVGLGLGGGEARSGGRGRRGWLSGAGGARWGLANGQGRLPDRGTGTWGRRGPAGESAQAPAVPTGSAATAAP